MRQILEDFKINGAKYHCLFHQKNRSKRTLDTLPERQGDHRWAKNSHPGATKRFETF